MKTIVLTGESGKVESTAARAARLSVAARPAVVAAAATVLLLAILHVLSPEFDPSFRLVSEYALGHYGWVLTLFFLAWGISAWALAIALWPTVTTGAGKVGLGFLVLAGLGETMAAVFDLTQATGHAIAGLLGMGGFPVAAVLLSVSLGRTPAWRAVRSPLLWLANLNWISIVLLGATLVLMAAQFAQVSGGTLPQQAPAHLPAGVLGLDGWADRLNVLSNCLWVAVAARPALQLADRQASSR